MVPVGYCRIILPARLAGWAGLRRLAAPAAEASQQRAAGAAAVPAAAP
jgi:hypothetical protein